MKKRFKEFMELSTIEKVLYVIIFALFTLAMICIVSAFYSVIAEGRTF